MLLKKCITEWGSDSHKEFNSILEAYNMWLYVNQKVGKSVLLLSLISVCMNHYLL